MKQAYVTSNPLIRSVVHKWFSEAIWEIGLPEFPFYGFAEEISPYLHHPDSLFEENEKSLTKLWKSILRGEVIATEVLDDEVFMFYVRGGFAGRVMDVRLTCHKHQWHIDSVISMYSRPLMRSPWFNRGTFAAAVVVAALIGYGVHQPTLHSSQSVAVSTLAATQADNKAQAKGTSSVSNTMPVAAKPNVTRAQPRVVRFTLSLGMPLYNLAEFLYKQHLVSNAMGVDMLMKKIGIDRDIKPGTYSFHTGMTEKQIIWVLQNRPKNV
jgi:hypothetical protein